MNVLIACEESQRVCSAFRSKGHNAFSCDILDCSGGHPEWHIKTDVLALLSPSDFIDQYGQPQFGFCFTTCDGRLHEFFGYWDLIIAFPPCTFMSKAGARWMFANGELNHARLKKALAAKSFFMEILNADCDKIAIENPVPLKIVGLPIPNQKIQPYYFGDPFSKCTCLWLKGLPNLIPTFVLDDYSPYVPSNTGNFSRGFGGSRGIAHNSKDRSKTFAGIAAAMADQWG